VARERPSTYLHTNTNTQPRGFGWRIHCGVEVTVLSTNKQHTLSLLRKTPTDRMLDVHMLHHTQSVPMLDETLTETSALRGNMPQRNDEEGGKQPRLFFFPAASVSGQMGRAWTTGGRNALRTTESITEKDYVA
jgi:hypothetical protein